jgi:hypothetical protein
MSDAAFEIARLRAELAAQTARAQAAERDLVQARALAFSDEGGQFLGGHAMNSENRQKTLAAFNDLWQGNPIRRTRSGEGHMTLYGRRVAVHLMAQPGVVRSFMADPMAADTGFAARFLMCEPPSTIGTRMQANARRDDMALAGFAALMHAILETAMPMDPETRELQPRILRASLA